MSRLQGSGKNDGSVQGERYFDCKPKHGVFVRPSQVTILEAPKLAVSPKCLDTGPPTDMIGPPSRC